MLKLIILLFFVLSLSSCSESSEEPEIETSISTELSDEIEIENENGDVASSVEFSGIQSITNITSNRAELNWVAVSGVALYVVYDMTSGSPVYKASVSSPASSLVVGGLNKGTAYTFRVRILDTSGLSDVNSKDLSMTTVDFSNHYSMQLGNATHLDTGIVDDMSGSGDFSISVWFKGSNSEYLVTQSHIASYSSDFIVGGASSSLFWMRGQTLGAQSLIEDGLWHHIVFVWNKNSEKYKGYVDGALIGESAVVSGYGGIGTSIIVGSRGDATTSYASGLVDELAIYNKVLTDADVTSLYNNGTAGIPSTTDLMSWWRMGDDANDDHTFIVDQEAVSNITAVGMDATDIVQDVPN